LPPAVVLPHLPDHLDDMALADPLDHGAVAVPHRRGLDRPGGVAQRQDGKPPSRIGLLLDVAYEQRILDAVTGAERREIEEAGHGRILTRNAEAGTRNWQGKSLRRSDIPWPFRVPRSRFRVQGGRRRWGRSVSGAWLLVTGTIAPMRSSISCASRASAGSRRSRGQSSNPGGASRSQPRSESGVPKLTAARP